jgi:predicted amidophosphoribosyltransferase
MGDWRDAALWTLLGTQCVGCDSPGRPWCQRCTACVAQAVDPISTGDDPPLIVCCRYEDPIPDAIVGFKDRGVGSLRPLLGHVLAAGLLHAMGSAPVDRGPTSAEPPTVVPVASSSSAVRRRGFDHMWQVARFAAAVVHLPAARVLRTRPRADQSRLSFAARRRNLEESMRVRAPGRGPVILVDDVRTSGATLRESRRALAAGGYSVMAQVVIAGSIVDPTCGQGR